MLTECFNITIENKLEELDFAVQFIDCEHRRQNMVRTIYSRLSPAVKSLPVDMNWVVKTEYDDCIKALMTLSAILNFLNVHKHVFEHDDEKQCIVILKDVYSKLREGLREHGCRKPPYKTGTPLTAYDILRSSEIINERYQR